MKSAWLLAMCYWPEAVGLWTRQIILAALLHPRWLPLLGSLRCDPDDVSPCILWMYVHEISMFRSSGFHARIKHGL